MWEDFCLRFGSRPLMSSSVRGLGALCIILKKKKLEELDLGVSAGRGEDKE